MLILAFGSHFKGDDLAWKVATELDGFDVQICNTPEDVLDVSQDVCIIDVVKGLSEVRFVNIDELKTRKTVTSHDFDIAFFLKLIKETGTVFDLKVIGIPEKWKVQAILPKIHYLLKTLDR